MRRLPADFIEQFGLPWHATVADAFDARDASPRAFSTTQAYFESALAVTHFDGPRLASVKLYPVTLGYDEPRSHRGRPRLASPQDGRRIIEELAAMSQTFGTTIQYRDGVGVIDLGARSSAVRAQ